MKRIVVGITAHVDSGKTTLSEALLYVSGKIRSLGRVDHGDSQLDTDEIERSRGITVFAHQAEFSCEDTQFTLLDTPGHVDFSAETERVMQALDCAVLVVSGTDGVQSHTVTLWRLLEKYNIPVFIFVNKMDLNGADKNAVMEELKARLSPCCADFSNDSVVAESAAMSSDFIAEKYLDGEEISDSDIAREIWRRNIFPCCFGSALKLEGVEYFLKVLGKFSLQPERESDFGARVFKISSDNKGNRLTYMKICGGELRVRNEISYLSAKGELIKEKVGSIRFYSGEKFNTSEMAESGQVCAVTGLTKTYSGQGLGCEENSREAVLEPVMSYCVILPENANVYDVLQKFRTLEEEDPQLHIEWNEQTKEIRAKLMGEVQLEVLEKVFENRFGIKIGFDKGTVAYKETIEDICEGVGHYEPLCHYAEVHLILQPLERGSGLQFELRCSEDELDRNWQRLILTHLEEKTHLGVLTGSPITDMKIIVAAGKAHLKHTEGGDFRQATYRAVRNGLRKAKSILLEPWYDFELELPSECVGRAMTDIQNMCGEFNPPETVGEMTLLTGSAPASEMNGYQSEVTGYTKGRGHLSCITGGYRECHNADEVVLRIGYDCDGDLENTADSVFCSHGAGFAVKWDKVEEYMHLPSCLEKAKKEEEERIVSYERAKDFCSKAVEDKELMEIFERTYGKINRDPRKAFKSVKRPEPKYKGPKLPVRTGPEYLLVDGYNIIFAWDELKKLSEENLDAARGKLADILCNYQGYKQCEIILVFDAYKVKEKHRDVEKYYNINIVYTKESETADTFIERTTHQLSKNHKVRVATSDGMEQKIILGNGALRVSAEEFRIEVLNAEKAVRDYIDSMR